MTRWFFEDGRGLDVGDLADRGGEAGIYVVPELQIAAKIYHKEAWTREAKVRAMIARPPSGALGAEPVIAWPTAVLVDAKRRFAGFTMPLVSGKQPLARYISPRDRKQWITRQHPKFPYQCAKNLASVMNAIHAAGYVVGDVNDRNFLVDRRALVALVDADSLQVRAANQVFRCSVGTPDFTPPELLGRDLSSVDRTVEHDAFGLAVLIFYLLSNGIHPFRAVPISPDADVPADAANIRAGRFAFAGTVPGYVPPPYAPRWATLDPKLRAAFERTFIAGHREPWKRTTPSEWIGLITQAEARASKCRRNPEHAAYWSGLADCPTCDPHTGPKPSAISRAATAFRRTAVRLLEVGSGRPIQEALQTVATPAAPMHVRARPAVVPAPRTSWVAGRELRTITTVVAAASMAALLLLSILVAVLSPGDRSTAAAPVATPAPAIPQHTVEPLTSCGRAHPPDRVPTAEWSGYSCRAPRGGADRSACLGWRRYTDSPAHGCPGAELCCPPARIAGVTALPAEVCVREGPLAIRVEQRVDSQHVMILEPRSRVFVTRTEGEWARVERPVAGWAPTDALGACRRRTRTRVSVASTGRSDGDAATARSVDMTPEIASPATDPSAATSPASDSTAPAPDPLGAVRERLAADDIPGAVAEFRRATGRGISGLNEMRAEIARRGANVVRAMLIEYDCVRATAIHRQLDSIGAGAESTPLIERWCSHPR